MNRRDVTFPSGGLTCAGWLYEPEQPGPYPVIVMAHGLGAVRDMRLPAFAERFVQAGYACLLFDYRHFGDSEGQPRQLLDVRKQLDDIAAAISFARGLPNADAERIVMWGTSFAGGHAIETASYDHRLAAAISQCPFTDGVASALVSNPFSSVKVSVLAAADVATSLVGMPPVQVSLAGNPGSASLMAADDCVDGYLGLVPDNSRFANRVAARIGMKILLYRPGGHARDVQCPILFALCENDTIAPSKVAEKYARSAKRGEIRKYPIGHFDIYVGDGFEQAVADQLDFLQRHVPIHSQGSESR
jgi:dienelactone hydrolase